MRSPTLNGRVLGSWGCLQMMTVTPVMSSSSSTATVVSTGSPENTWLGHWARTRLRIISRRTARVKVENRLDSRSQRRQDLGSQPPPHAAHIRKGHCISKTPPQLLKTHCLLHAVNSRIQPKRSPTAHQAGRHIHRQCGQISEWGWYR